MIKTFLILGGFTFVKRPLTFTLIGFALSSILIALSPHIIFFIFFRFLQGFTGAVAIVIALCSSSALIVYIYLRKTISLN